MVQLTASQAFGKRLRRERWLLAAERDRAVEDQEIAEHLGVSPSTVGRWFEGATLPRADTMAHLAAFFGVTPSWLHYGQEPREATAPASKVKIETGERKRMDVGVTPTKAASVGGGKRRK